MRSPPVNLRSCMCIFNIIMTTHIAYCNCPPAPPRPAPPRTHTHFKKTGWHSRQFMPQSLIHDRCACGCICESHLSGPGSCMCIGLDSGVCMCVRIGATINFVKLNIYWFVCFYKCIKGTFIISHWYSGKYVFMYDKYFTSNSNLRHFEECHHIFTF